MTVHSTRLGAIASAAIGAHNLYTVPAGKRTIVKQLTIYNHAAAANRVVWEMTAGGTTFVLLSATAGAAGSATETVSLPCWIVLNAGDVLTVAPQGGVADATASGAELTL